MKISKIIFVLVILIQSPSINAQFKLPQYEKIILGNSLTIYLMEKKDVPLISFHSVFNAGSVKDGNNSGIASFTAEVLKSGTINYTKTELDSIFNFYGSSLNTYTNPDYSGLYTRFMKDDIDKLMPLLKEVIMNPVFAAEEIEKRKVRWVAELDQVKESPRAVIRDYFNKFLFGVSPYGNSVDGTKSGINTLTPELVRSFYNNNYNPRTSAIAVAGDFDSGKIKNMLTELFSNWSAGDITSSTEIKVEIKKEEPAVYLINKANATETTFLIGAPGVEMSIPELTQINVINTILGGRFTAWLNDELRVNSGLTYGAFSRFNSYKTGGTFSIITFTSTENTEKAIDLAVKTYNRLFEKGIDREILASAKNYVKGQFPPDYETAGSMAELLTKMYIFGLSDSYINDFEKNVDDLTPEKASGIISKYFSKDNLQFVLIGKADEIRETVKKYGKITERNLDEDGF